MLIVLVVVLEVGKTVEEDEEDEDVVGDGV